MIIRDIYQFCSALEIFLHWLIVSFQRDLSLCLQDLLRDFDVVRGDVVFHDLVQCNIRKFLSCFRCDRFFFVLC